MGAKKGSNGIQDGEDHAEIFRAWVEETKDFKPYIYQGLLNISRIARESDLNRDVFYTNPDIRDTQLPALTKKLEDDGVLKLRVANPAEDIPRQPRGNPTNDARIKQIQEEHEAVKAENRELRRQLAKVNGIVEILHSTGRIPL